MREQLFCVVGFCRHGQDKQEDQLLVEHLAAVSAEEAVKKLLAEKRSACVEYWTKKLDDANEARARLRGMEVIEDKSCGLSDAPPRPVRGNEWSAFPVSVPGREIILKMKNPLVLKTPAGILEG